MPEPITLSIALAILGGVATAAGVLLNYIQSLYKWFKRRGYRHIAGYCKYLKHYVRIYEQRGFLDDSGKANFRYYLERLQNAEWKNKLQNEGQRELLESAQKIENMLD
ncbi:hypothetical protein TWF694_010506 [Orbilia ellipsospora]|uniref:Uncharacterized protein n=1 Tax=Orbilia ellipsospora TaxID=2528407 RepID=A0AAV9XBF7_9PEZI